MSRRVALLTAIINASTLNLDDLMALDLDLSEPELVIVSVENTGR